jgi:hypothetical protein
VAQRWSHDRGRRHLVTHPVTGPTGISAAQPTYARTRQQPDLWNTGSCESTKTRGHRGRTPTCGWTTFGGLSASACPSTRWACGTLSATWGSVGAEVRMPPGEPWRVGKRPYGRSALSTAVACLKGFYLHQASFGSTPISARSSTRADCRRERTAAPSSGTRRSRCPQTRWFRTARAAGIRRCCRTARGRRCWETVNL